MADLHEKVNVEFENISAVLKELVKIKDKNSISTVELAGMGTFLHNFYTGVENILKQILISRCISIPESGSWHRDLLILSSEQSIITENMRNKLAKYLAFRHFFVHAYGFTLDKKELDLLVDNVFEIYNAFKEEISVSISS